MRADLSARSVGREDDADDGAAVLPASRRSSSVERTRAFGELLEARAASLAGRVVGDHGSMPSVASPTRTEMRVGGPRRIAWCSASRMIWKIAT